MQFPAWRAALALLAALPQGFCKYAAVQHHESGLAAASLQAAWASAVAAESEDRRFWASEWSAMEAELLELQEVAVTAEQRPKKAAFMQLNNGTKAAAATAPKRHSPLTGLKVNLNPKSKADLLPALAMLKGLYEDGKQRIAQLNAREKEYKERYAEKEKEHKARMARIAARNGTVSDEFLANETRDENRMWSYWERVRERQHRQFHTSLKIQHATLSKVKTMMDVYEKTIAGKESDPQVQKELKKVAGGVMPDVVLLQATWRDAATFCRETLQQLRAAGAELGDGGIEP